MSSSDNNCLGQACEAGMQSFCDNCTDSCTRSCETTCQENCEQACNQACQNACDQACQNACSNVACTCGSSPSQVIFPVISTIIIPFMALLILGLFQAFDPRGPLYLTLLGAGLLTISLTGVNFRSKHSYSSCSRQISNYRTRIGFITINHSHHSPELIEKGHEFRLRGKYFCTGCYGILAGTCISIAISFLYLTGYFSSNWIFILPLMSCGCFIPIIIRYTGKFHFGSKIRFLSNSLLPIGCSLTIIYTDMLFHDWLSNSIVMILILVVAYLRSIVGKRENQGEYQS